ncbi:hypothetical protein N7281_00615 [Rickettsia hoogstraalii]|uniref:hypothetical protein n=1 Tax=Rickettsia hoogstraalii TaxID=467174 RepID=UPI002253FE6A|nr:hypothetical protein [Rickettsia hoogstraalii]MCX4083411.1 hypothetical protein [Rickettsia hoogstraalii]
MPIEVKISSNVHNSELRGIKSFIEEHQISKGYIVCLEPKLRKVIWGTQEIDIIPLQQFLEKLWNHEILE